MGLLRVLGALARLVGLGRRGRVAAYRPTAFTDLAAYHISGRESTVPPPNEPLQTRQQSFLRRQLMRMPWRLRLLIVLPFAGAASGLAMLAVLMVYYTIAYPNPHVMRSQERAPVVRILAGDGSVLAERGAAHDYMPLDLLPRHVQAAVVATEDRRFYDHHGVDPVGMIRAFFANLRAGRFAQGGSTLTQQLAKNLFLTHDRTLGRKLEEFALALWLEVRLPKSEILELYLNRVYFGGGAYGIEAASQRYFDRSARELTLAQAALIAGLLKAPSRYSPSTSPEAAMARARVVLDKMVETGFISPEDERKALAEKIVFHEPKQARDSAGFGYVIDFVLERLPPLLGNGDAEIVVETTLDSELQQQANRVVTSALARKGAALGASQAALVVLDAEGGIRALVGGRDYAASQYNRASKARRQPGSAFKPFVYLAAMESGLTPDSVAYDLPLTLGGWSPKNDSGTYAGEVTLRRALAQSINTVAVRLNQDVGRGRTAEVARRLGVRSELRDDASLALGTSEVSLLEMTGAYAVLGNGGMSVEPHIIRRVRMSSGRVLYARKAARTDQLVDSRVVGAMNDMLNATLVTGTGRRAAIANHAAAGKTGTTQDFRDAWFIGYTSHLCAGVWIGNDDSKPMNRSVGGGLPAEMWHELMVLAHKNKAPLALPGTTQRPATDPTGIPLADAGATPTASRIPRVDQTSENLPWLSRQLSTSWQAHVADPVGDGETSAKPAHPTERIDEDFIAKVLAETNTANHPASRPNGLMSLGGWW